MKYQNVAVVWLKKDKNGKTYLSFKAERDIKAGENIALFKNDKGGVETRPDYKAYEQVDDDTVQTKEEEPSVDDIDW